MGIVITTAGAVEFKGIASHLDGSINEIQTRLDNLMKGLPMLAQEQMKLASGKQGSEARKARLEGFLPLVGGKGSTVELNTLVSELNDLVATITNFEMREYRIIAEKDEMQKEEDMLMAQLNTLKPRQQLADQFGKDNQERQKTAIQRLA